MNYHRPTLMEQITFQTACMIAATEVVDGQPSYLFPDKLDIPMWDELDKPAGKNLINRELTSLVEKVPVAKSIDAKTLCKDVASKRPTIFELAVICRFIFECTDPTLTVKTVLKELKEQQHSINRRLWFLTMSMFGTV